MAGTLPWEELASCPPLASLWLGRWGSPWPGPIWLGWASSASSHWLVSCGPAFVQLEQDRWGLGSCGPVLGPGQWDSWVWMDWRPTVRVGSVRRPCQQGTGRGPSFVFRNN